MYIYIYVYIYIYIYIYVYIYIYTNIYIYIYIYIYTYVDRFGKNTASLQEITSTYRLQCSCLFESNQLYPKRN